MLGQRFNASLWAQADGVAVAAVKASSRPLSRGIARLERVRLEESERAAIRQQENIGWAGMAMLQTGKSVSAECDPNRPDRVHVGTRVPRRSRGPCRAIEPAESARAYAATPSAQRRVISPSTSSGTEPLVRMTSWKAFTSNLAPSFFCASSRSCSMRSMPIM